MHEAAIMSLSHAEATLLFWSLVGSCSLSKHGFIRSDRPGHCLWSVWEKPQATEIRSLWSHAPCVMRASLDRYKARERSAVRACVVAPWPHWLG